MSMNDDTPVGVAPLQRREAAARHRLPTAADAEALDRIAALFLRSREAMSGDEGAILDDVLSIVVETGRIEALDSLTGVPGPGPDFEPPERELPGEEP